MGERVERDVPVLHGPDFSVYVQAVRLVLAAKGVEYRMSWVDPFEDTPQTRAYREINPFGKVPALSTGGQVIYEADAIARYLDAAYGGIGLMPEGARERAVADQMLGILRSFAYPAWVRTLYMEQVARPRRGEAEDAGRVSAALPVARTALVEMRRLAPARGPYLCGAGPMLPDFFCAPMYACLRDAPAGRELIAGLPGLEAWWEEMERLAYFGAIVV